MITLTRICQEPISRFAPFIAKINSAMYMIRCINKTEYFAFEPTAHIRADLNLAAKYQNDNCTLRGDQIEFKDFDKIYYDTIEIIKQNAEKLCDTLYHKLNNITSLMTTESTKSTFSTLLNNTISSAFNYTQNVTNDLLTSSTKNPNTTTIAPDISNSSFNTTHVPNPTYFDDNDIWDTIHDYAPHLILGLVLLVGGGLYFCYKNNNDTNLLLRGKTKVIVDHDESIKFAGEQAPCVYPSDDS